ncbi:MAG TPA: DoxX family protein [Euzebyales bacterium]
MLGFIRRTLLAAIFLFSSTNAIQNAEQMTAPAEALGLPEPANMVRLHGAINLIGGLMLVFNIKPKLAAWAMVGNLIPTTVGGHQFWEESDEGAKINQLIHFMKNVSLLGGLLTVISAERRCDDDVS